MLLTNYRRQAPVACEMYQILSKGLNENKPGAVDLNAIDEILGQVPPASRGLNAWLVGLFLKNHGKPEDARRYLKLALGLPGVSEWGQAKANMSLRAWATTKRAEGRPSERGADLRPMVRLGRLAGRRVQGDGRPLARRIGLFLI